MVTSATETKEIGKILLTYIPIEEAIDMINEIWDDVGLKTSNQSLEETILLLKKFLEVKWEYSLLNQNEYPFQGPVS